MTPMPEPLHEFYAVTMTSVYRVTDVCDIETGVPFVEKIAMRRNSTPVGYKFRKGKYIGLLSYWILNGLVSFDKTFEDQKYPEQGDMKGWGDLITTPVVALFFFRQNAMACFHELDLQPFDERWLQETRAVCEAIGDDHSVFVVSPTFLEALEQRKS